MKSVLNIHWMDWCWSWNSNTLATWCEELTHWKRPLYWKRLKAGGEGDDRGWDGWMASLTLWTSVWVSSGSWRWTEKTGVLQSMGLQRVGQDSVTELNWNILGKSPWGESDLLSIIFSLSGDYSRPIHYIGRYWVIGDGKVNSREGNGTPLQYSCLENPMDGEAWWAAIYGVAQSRTQLKWLSSSSSSIIVRKTQTIFLANPIYSGI